MFNLDVVSSATSVSNVNGLVKFSETKKDVKDEVEFSNILEKTINDVNNSQLVSNDKIDKFIKGEDVSVHEVMVSMQEAQMSMQLLVEARNKVVEAYQELNRLSL